MSTRKVEKEKEKREWTDDEVFQLISLYEEQEFLWNVTHKSYKIRDKKLNALAAIAKKFINCDVNELQRKIHNLRNQVSHELHRMKKLNSGDGADEKYNSKWKFFNALQFIVPYVTIVRTVAKINDTVDQPVMSQDEETPNLNGAQIKENKKKRQSRIQDDDNVIKEVIEIVKKPKDDFERFGEYVALELRSLKSDFYRGQLKGDIRRAIANICDMDERNYWLVPTPKDVCAMCPAHSGARTAEPLH